MAAMGRRAVASVVAFVLGVWLASAAVGVQAAETANVRVLNELCDALRVTISGDSSTAPFGAIPVHGASDYVSTAAGDVSFQLVGESADTEPTTARGTLQPGVKYTLAVAAGRSVDEASWLLLEDMAESDPRRTANVDTASVRLLSAWDGRSSNTSKGEAVDVALNSTSADCYHCLRLFTGTARAIAGGAQVNGTDDFLNISTQHFTDMTWTAPSGAHMNASVLFYEHGVYTVVVAGNDGNTTANSPVYVTTDIEGNNVALPIVATLGILAGLAILWNVTHSLSKYLSFLSWLTPVFEYTEPNKPGRVRSIDSFRGMALTIMIFVNAGGGNYWFLDHSAWNGLTVADLVFPWFVWIMGVSMAISLNSAQKRGVDRRSLVRKMVWRAAKLFMLGMFLNNGYMVKYWRILGVLQYFGVAAFSVGLTALLVPVIETPPPKRRETDADTGTEYEDLVEGGAGGDAHLQVHPDSELSDGSGRRRAAPGLFDDILPYRWQYMLPLVCLAVYLGVQFGLDVPGCGRGYIGPGGLGDWGRHEGCTGGAHRYVDVQLWGENHMYSNAHPDKPPTSAATCAPVYGCDVYDPEGTLGWLTAATIAFLGLCCGRIIVHYKDHASRMRRWGVWGVVCTAIATALCGASQNEGVIPINKNLWSPSFIFVMAGTGFLVLSLFYYVIDVRKWWRGGPFRFVGMNSILVYAGSEIFQVYFPFQSKRCSPSSRTCAACSR